MKKYIIKPERKNHIDKAVHITNLKPSGKNGEAEGEPIHYSSYVSMLLINNEYFTCTKYDIKDDVTLNAINSSFNSVIVIEGSRNIIYHS